MVLPEVGLMVAVAEAVRGAMLAKERRAGATWAVVEVVLAAQQEARECLQRGAS
jgi:hypothetical protein